jgi:prepilin-type processing-associated H-X9-DG protein
VIVSVSLLLLWTLPVAGRTKGRSPRVKCTGALKQVALAFNLWAMNHESGFPFEVPVAAGGSREYALDGNIVSNFVIAADEIRDPKILTCPSDTQRKPAVSFAKLTRANMSYFLNVDAKMIEPNAVIAGDREIVTNGVIVRPGLLTITNTESLSWAKTLHGGGGNIALADGSVHQVTAHGLRNQLAHLRTNRLIIP